MKKIFSKNLLKSFIFFIFHFGRIAKKRFFIHFWKSPEKKLKSILFWGNLLFFTFFRPKNPEKYTILGEKIFFSSNYSIFSFFLFIYSFFILAEKPKKRFSRKFYSIFFSGVFSIFFYSPRKKRFSKKKIFMKQAVFTRG